MNKQKRLEDIRDAIKSGNVRNKPDVARQRIQDTDGRYVSIKDDDILEVIDRRLAAITEEANG
jgi:hypothetical protein